MKCPICEATLRPGTDRCPTCGCRYPHDYTRPHGETEKPKSTKGKCCCLIPAIIAVVVIGLLIGAGVTAFRMAEDIVIAPEPEPAMSIPMDESLPETASEECFAIMEGAVVFLPDAWDGGPIVNVPETVGGQTVTAIGAGAFRDCAELTTIILPDTVTAIHPEAFSGCTNLRGLFVPKTTEFIGKDAFSGCISLEAIYIPSAVDSIASGCFDDCAALMYIFYEGYFEDWQDLYDDYINPFTTAVCLDGSYYHGVQE